jgi:hypothetical protein
LLISRSSFINNKCYANKKKQIIGRGKGDGDVVPDINKFIKKITNILTLYIIF